ncbi:hypothetical protein [Dyadobacter arcticus]|uniref:Outer membrane protein beta-barrel domain-containing protein n=1 Tax=Dyadobacter arcticus TaxID=1078754 RepID=A0ABX0UTW2_9BACT|nr:hypothetical protein [Dyadobacter arcticus]NIJ55230.1 hypothetical protein [Dyadobacter arcticus]
MRKFFTILVVASLCLVTSVEAQHAPFWEFGVLAEYGQDRYQKSYAPEIFYEGSITNFSSKCSWCAGFYLERSLNPHWSVIGQVFYAQRKVQPQTFYFPSQTAAQWYWSEVHHRGVADAGLRWYLNPQSKICFFAEGKLGANVFISAVQHEQTFGRIVHSNVFGFQRTAPIASCSLGFKWSRLTVSAEYRDDLLVSKRDDKRTGISSRGVFGKVAFTLIRKDS